MWSYANIFLIFCCVLLFNISGCIGKHNCSITGVLDTDLNWFGFLSVGQNVGSSGSKLEYNVAYTKQNNSLMNLVLYFDDQIPFLENTTSCRSNEEIVRPENNQIIILSEQNPWSGCHTANESGLPILKCSGARTFRSVRDRHWYVAASSCNSSTGIKLKYQMKFSNVLGDCDPMRIQPGGIFGSSLNDTLQICTSNDQVDSEENFYGFVNLDLQAVSPQFTYNITYDSAPGPLKMLLYTESDLPKVEGLRSCSEKEALVKGTVNSVIDLTDVNWWSGCQQVTGSSNIQCQGRLIFRRSQRFRVAFSRCETDEGINLLYEFVYSTLNPAGKCVTGTAIPPSAETDAGINFSSEVMSNTLNPGGKGVTGTAIPSSAFSYLWYVTMWAMCYCPPP